MTGAAYIVGDVRDTLSTVPDNSVDLILTSPPFLALRSYLPADHPDKHREIGSEPGPAEFLDTLLGLSAEWRRVLAPHGSIAIELGDTYSGSGGAGGDYAPDGMRAGQSKFDGSNHRRGRIVDHDSGRRTPGPGWPLAKSLAMIPELYRVALAYGIHPLTGEPSPAGSWRVRNVVRWARPNPPVGALGDKFRPATSDMVIACTSRTRYFDLDSVREPSSPNTNARTAKGVAARPNDCKTSPDGNRDSLSIQHRHDTAPPLDHWWADPDDTFDQDAWLIPTHGFPGAHYATFPPALCVRPIEAMCPRRVCTVCGEPSRRIVELESHGEWCRTDLADSSVNHGGPGTHGDRTRQSTTLGWSDCGHNAWRPGIVLDPFGGSGTTAVVATGHGRNCLLIDLDERNADLARNRVGMFLSVIRHGEPLPDWLSSPHGPRVEVAS